MNFEGSVDVLERLGSCIDSEGRTTLTSVEESAKTLVGNEILGVTGRRSLELNGEMERFRAGAEFEASASRETSSDIVEERAVEGLTANERSRPAKYIGGKYYNKYSLAE